MNLRINSYPVNHKLKKGDIVKVQNSSLYRDNLFLLLSVTENVDDDYKGEILGIEGFNRGDEGAVFRKLYPHDSIRFDFSSLKTGDNIDFNINNVFQ